MLKPPARKKLLLIFGCKCRKCKDSEGRIELHELDKKVTYKGKKYAHIPLCRSCHAKEHVQDRRFYYN